MSAVQSAWAMAAVVPPLQKLLLLGLAEEATYPDEPDTVFFAGDRRSLTALAERCSMTLSQCRALLAELRAAGLVQDGSAPGTIRFTMGHR